jgi:hypothetical protein
MTNRRDRRSSSFAVDQVEHEVLAAPTGLDEGALSGLLIRSGTTSQGPEMQAKAAVRTFSEESP